MPAARKNKLYSQLSENKITHLDGGFRSFEFLFVENLNSNGEKLYGLTDFDTGKIFLELLMDEETAKETILHEIMHVVLELCGLGGSEDDSTNVLALLNNEQLTTLVSRGLLTSINLNSALYNILAS
jgi:hypothetical protein